MALVDVHYAIYHFDYSFVMTGVYCLNTLLINEETKYYLQK